MSLDAEAKAAFNQLADANDDVIDDLGEMEAPRKGRGKSPPRAPEPEPEPEPDEEQYEDDEEEADDPKEHAKWQRRVIALRHLKYNSKYLSKSTLHAIQSCDPPNMTVKEMKQLIGQVKEEISYSKSLRFVERPFIMGCQAVEMVSNVVGVDATGYAAVMNPAQPFNEDLRETIEEMSIDFSNHLSVPAHYRLGMIMVQGYSSVIDANYKKAQQKAAETTQRAQAAGAAAPVSRERADNIDDALNALPTGPVSAKA